MRFIILITFIAFPFFLQAQIVNIENQRIQSDTLRWFGTVGASIFLQKNTVQVFSTGVNAHVQYKSKRSLYLFLADYNFLKASHQTFSNNIFYHLRYNYKLNDWLRWEVFTQLQENKITGINLRLLAGSGPRFKIHRSKTISFYAGVAAMYEYEELATKPKEYKNNIRSSNYITGTYKPLDNFSLTGTVFYQPLYSNTSDYRILNEISINIAIVKNFSFVTTWSYLYDSRPVPGVPDVNYYLSSGVKYKF